jgi:PAS domain S-box-containing protein
LKQHQAPDHPSGQNTVPRGLKKAMRGRVTLASIVFLYALFAAAWIFFSDRALDVFVDPASITRMATVKGFAFVAVTSCLLYLLLSSWHASLPGAAGGDEAAGGRPKIRRMLLLFAAFVLIVPLFGLLVFKLQAAQVERDAYVNLQAIAQLKAGQIENWLGERHGNGLSLGNSTGFIDQVIKLRSDSNPEQQLLVKNQLEVMRRGYGYAAILLLDVEGRPLLAVGEPAVPNDATGGLQAKALASGEVQRADLWLNKDGRAHIDFIVPLVQQEKTKGHALRPVGSVLLRVHPETFLFPLIQSWPTASPSAETLLVRRVDDDIVFLNELRHRSGTAMTLKISQSAVDLPAAIAVRAAQPGITPGKDYRAVEVLSAYRPVSGTDWVLIAKVDRAEVMLPLWELVFWVCLVALVALVAIGVAFQLFWRQQLRSEHLRLLVQKDASLREGELRYRAVTESSSDAIVSADSEGRIVGWNASVERLFGYSAAELPGQPLTLLMPERFHNAHTKGMSRVLADGGSTLIAHTVEFTGRHKSGTEFPLELSLAQWVMDERRFYTGTMRDISERKANDARVQRLTKVYAVLSQCNQSIVRCASEDELFSQICCDAVDFGGMKMAWVGLVDAASGKVRPVAWFGEGADDYLHDIEVSIDAANPLGRGPIGTALREGRPVWSQDFLGDPLAAPWVERAARYGLAAIAALPFYRNGQVAGIFGLYTAETHPFDEPVRNLLMEMTVDVSLALDNFASEARRIEAEAQTRRLLAENETILRNVLVGIVHTRDRDVVSCNQRFEEILGYAPGELLGQSTEMLFESHDSFISVGERAYEALEKGRNYSEEVVFRRKDGSLFAGALNGRAIDPDHPLEGSIWIYADISERVRLEDQLHNHQVNLEVLVQKRTADLQDALEAAQLADIAKDAFLANVSHELRTPLNAVLGMADLARRLSHDSEQQAYLDKVGNAGKTLAHLIDDLLDLSKIVAGRLEFENDTFSLRSLIERSSSVMSYKATEKGLQLSEKIAEDIPDALIGDPHRIEQILLNLLSNAIKFTAAGHVEIRIDLLERQRERLCLAIEIEDSGVGLSQEEIDRLFKPFAQADASMTRKYGGSGLGLAICKRLVEMMGGQISVSSRPGHGSTFRAIVWLGIGRAEDVHKIEVAGETAVPLRYRNTRILVVEDQPLNREIVEALLKFVGIVPRMAGDGQQALDILDASGPDAFDLVLMDVQMPVMDGLTATRELRKRRGFEALPVIAMTAHTMEHEKEISAQAGMNDHIGKPFDNAGFYRTLARWIPLAKQQAGSALPDSVEQVGVQPASGFPYLSGIDTAGGLSRLAGNETRYRHWLNEFIEEGPANARQIRQSLAAGNTEAARQVAHAFKGRVGMLGMNELHNAASALEAALRQGSPVEGWLNKLEQIIEQTRHEIQRALGPRAESPPPASPTSGKLPQEPMPEAVVHLIEMLDASDGGSASAIARCLKALQGSVWEPRLQLALSHAQNFDFSAAVKALLA